MSGFFGIIVKIGVIVGVIYLVIRIVGEANDKKTKDQILNEKKKRDEFEG